MNTARPRLWLLADRRRQPPLCRTAACCLRMHAPQAMPERRCLPSPSLHPRSISDNGQVSILVVKGTQLVQEACTRHGTSPTASAALGRALLGTLLMGAFREQGEKT